MTNIKQPLILLHGALGSSAQLDPLVNTLTEHFDVYTFNFEGHGGRSSDQPFSIDLFVQNVIDFMTKNAIGSSHFFGYSMGGYVALKLAAHFPDKVEKIFTYGTKFDWTPETASQEVKMLNPEKILEKVPQFAKTLEQLHYPLDWKENMTKTADMMIALGNGKHLSESELKSIKQPVMLSIGTNDHMVTVEETENIVHALPSGELLVLNNWSHPIEKLDLRKLTEELLNFNA
jgi:pimeloyl-ACP methyl ester carboxylesterase